MNGKKMIPSMFGFIPKDNNESVYSHVSFFCRDLGWRFAKDSVIEGGRV